MPQRFPALLRAFGSVGNPLCPPVSTCFFPRLGHGLGQTANEAALGKRTILLYTVAWLGNLKTSLIICSAVHHRNPAFQPGQLCLNAILKSLHNHFFASRFRFRIVKIAL